jgi:hypothetical protein
MHVLSSGEADQPTPIKSTLVQIEDPDEGWFKFTE